MNRGYQVEQSHPEGVCGVGILAADEAGLEEIACLLARQDVALSRAVVAAADWTVTLQEFQNEPAVEVVILASRGDAATVDSLLEQVKRSDKPTVVCLLGSDPRLAWRAGAIPAGRLDEAARRAVAWIRNWDQALISSQLQEEDDVLSSVAHDLLRAVGPERGASARVLAPALLCHEARLMMAEVGGDDLAVSYLDLPAGTWPSLDEVAADMHLAVAVVALGLGTALAPERLGRMAQEVRAARAGGLLVCVHLYGPDRQALALAEATLDRAGAMVAASNAAAARLAGLVLGHMAVPRVLE
ncbi:MAG: hypothetical protein P8129_23255 [Anaerolineae bacterium]|jgi:hypothetical protein